MQSFITEAMIRQERRTELDSIEREADMILACHEAWLLGYDVPEPDVSVDASLEPCLS